MSWSGPVHTVVFDVGLTLLGVRPSYAEVFAAGCAQAGMELPPSALDLLGDGWGLGWREHIAAWEATGAPSPHAGDDLVEVAFWTGLYRRQLELLGVEGELAPTIYTAFIAYDAFAPFPDVEPALDLLERRGVRLGILSNWGGWLRGLLDHHKLVERFEAIVVSAEERVVKPDQAIFARLLDRLGERAGPHVAYVGDDLRTDVHPARELGLTAVLVDRHDRYPDHDGPRVRDLRELSGVIPLVRRAADGSP